MNNCVLNNVLLNQLMRLTFLQTNATLKTRSASIKCEGNRIRASNLGKNGKTSRNRINETTKRRKKCSVPLKKIKILNANGLKKIVITDSIQNRTNGKIPEKRNKVPIVILRDVLTTQERISKSDYMQYIGLKVNGSSIPKFPEHVSNSGLIKFSQAVNVPVSSDMGIKMASGDNHVVSKKYKLYKIQRCEQYINRNPIVKRNTKDCGEKLLLNKKKKCLKKYCKEVSVNVIRLDLNKIRENMAKRKKHFISKVKKNMQKNIENLQVIITPCEKKIVDLLLKKENLKNDLL